MTGTELIDAVKGGLGNRSSGLIGSLSVDASAVESLNRAVRETIKFYKPTKLQERTTLDLTTANYYYSLTAPTSIALATVHKILNARLVAQGETSGRWLRQIPTILRDQLEPIMDSSRTGRPVFYNLFADTIEFYPWPDQNYTVHLKYFLRPPDISANTAELHMGKEWDDIIVAYAIGDCFAKLQQTMDAKNWFGIWQTRLRGMVGDLREQPSMPLDITITDLPRPYYGSEPGLDPFVRRNW